MKFLEFIDKNGYEFMVNPYEIELIVRMKSSSHCILQMKSGREIEVTNNYKDVKATIEEVSNGM